MSVPAQGAWHEEMPGQTATIIQYQLGYPKSACGSEVAALSTRKKPKDLWMLPMVISRQPTPAEDGLSQASSLQRREPYAILDACKIEQDKVQGFPEIVIG